MIGFDCPKEIYVGIDSSKWEDFPLAYVTYIKNGEVYKAKSFNSWCSKTAPKKTFTNEPIEGFKVLFNVGGCKSGWNVRQSYFRVQDPRGFEFEILADNFVNILQNAVINKGVISGKYVYVWRSTQLMLLSETDKRYEAGVSYNENINSGDKVTKDNIQIGQGYYLRDYDEAYYIGKFKWYGYQEKKNENNDPINISEHYSTSMYTFIAKSKYEWEHAKYIIVGYKDIKNIKYSIGKSVSQKVIDKAIEAFNNTNVAQPIGNLIFAEKHASNWSLENHPEYKMTYDEWITSPLPTKKDYSTGNLFYKYCDFLFYERNKVTGVKSYCFSDGIILNICEYEIYFDQEKNQIVVNWFDLSKRGYYYGPFDLDRIKPKFTGDVSKLINAEGESHTFYSSWRTINNNGHEVAVPMDTSKSYATRGAYDKEMKQLENLF